MLRHGSEDSLDESGSDLSDDEGEMKDLNHQLNINTPNNNCNTTLVLSLKCIRLPYAFSFEDQLTQAAQSFEGISSPKECYKPFI
jgi:hypothetical protein